jgi:hypothetical protein
MTLFANYTIFLTANILADMDSNPSPDIKKDRGPGTDSIAYARTRNDSRACEEIVKHAGKKRNDACHY